ncbi:MAG: hypothetical protein L6V78_05405 [Clostridium sp.]|nr:MAG: hypothetical protein L6V78_05405 [Clostridium sp.]
MKKNSFVTGTFIATASVILVKILGMLYVVPFFILLLDQKVEHYIVMVIISI